MKRIEYPPRNSQDFQNILSDYLRVFDIPKMERMWNNWKNKYGESATFPETVDKLLIADVDLIAEIYERFIALGIPKKIIIKGQEEKNPQWKELECIFKYSRCYDDKIAAFFIRQAKKLNISTCYYCDSAYINVYTLSNTHTIRRKFDIDHFLPKSECPILALSLFNFVPSCQVCNSRIKLENVLGQNKAERGLLNPAGENYTFDKDVRIRLRMNRVCTSFANTKIYNIYFHCNNVYRQSINFFHLEERYEFHKAEAIRLQKLKQKYPNSTIKRIAKLLRKSPKSIHEDIFNERFISLNERCFAKLTRDMLRKQ